MSDAKVKMSPERLAILRNLEDETVRTNERLMAYRKECLCEAPVKVGDEVEVNDWAYKGKRMKVESVVLAKHFGSYHWKAYGKVLRKDGTVGSNEAKSTWEIEE